MTRRCWIIIIVATLTLTACAAPARMHEQAALDTVALGCGLTYGELIQDAEQKKLLLLIHDNPNAQQRRCVTRWAHRNGLRPVFVNMQFPQAGGGGDD